MAFWPALALLEGDATVSMLAWAFANLEPQELAEITSTPQPDTTGIPSWLVEQTAVFPYNEGYLWAGSTCRRPAQPGLRGARCRLRRPSGLDRADHRRREVGPARRADPGRGARPRRRLRRWLDRGRRHPDRPGVPGGHPRLPRGRARGGGRPQLRGGAATRSSWRPAPTTPSPSPGAWCGTRPRMPTSSPMPTTRSSPASASRHRSPGLDDDEVLVAHGSSPDVLRRTIDAASD